VPELFGDVDVTYAANLKLGLADALEVCRLMARNGDERFPRAAS
jgi:hypothetical protein